MVTKVKVNFGTLLNIVRSIHAKFLPNYLQTSHLKLLMTRRKPINFWSHDQRSKSTLAPWNRMPRLYSKSNTFYGETVE